MGTRCNAFIEDSKSLLQTVWQLYRLNRLVEAADPSLRDDFSAEEVSRLLQTGLLCTQPSVALRPSMTEVVVMLTSSGCEIPLPSQTPFLNATLVEPESSKRSYCTSSFVSNAAIKVEAYSYTSTESSISSDRASRSEESKQN
ncbi:conserved hypothetical protein [Ricinus communis]|uniref:Uncharacterized protein n=1 Tax=Ricinus communis TaxID=3988 RepID=B9RVC3_RICCO|nr:conserved hypothetical protein [Ricinus communis]